MAADALAAVVNNLFRSLLVLCVGAHCLSAGLSGSTKSDPKTKSDQRGFRTFQIGYLCAYIAAVFADWLKGPYIYRLYQSNGFDTSQIAALFMAGYFSSAIFGTIAGSWADALGRRKMCLCFAVLYCFHALLHLSPNFWVLLTARLISGVATSLLHTAFESWLVAAHHAAGFAPELLTDTFAWCSMATSSSAIVAGIVSDLAAAQFGVLGPMLCTIPFLCVSFAVPLLSWGENYGDCNKGIVQALSHGVESIMHSKHIFLLGMVQLLFEGSMHVFIFSWTPQLQAVSQLQKAELPLGEVFSCFMAAFMLGSIVFKKMCSGGGGQMHAAHGSVFLLAALSFLVAAESTDFQLTLVSFVGFEVCCGLYYPMLSTIRSKYVKEESRAAVLSLFRLPMNLVVIMVLLWSSSWETRYVFRICAACQLGCFITFQMFARLSDEESEPVPAKVAPPSPVLTPILRRRSMHQS